MLSTRVLQFCLLSILHLEANIITEITLIVAAMSFVCFAPLNSNFPIVCEMKFKYTLHIKILTFSIRSMGVMDKL